MNVVASVLTFLSATLGYDPPLNAVMMLWVNLVRFDTITPLPPSPPTTTSHTHTHTNQSSTILNHPLAITNPLASDSLVCCFGF